MATDLPEPVVPATSRCGMRARSAITGSPPMVLPRQSASLCLVVLEVLGGEQFAQIDGLALVVGQLDADGVAALARRRRGPRPRSSSGRCRRPGEITRDDLMPGAGSSSYKVTTGPGLNLDDLAADAEILQHAFEQSRILLQRVGRDGRRDRRLLRLGQQRQRRQLEVVPVEQGGLGFAWRGACRASERGAGAATRGRR